MAQFTSEISIVKLGNGAVVKFVDGEYTAVDASEAKFLRSHPLVTEVDVDETVETTKEPSEYDLLKDKAVELGIEVNGKSKAELKDEIAAKEAA